MVCVPESMLPGKNRFRRTCITANMYKTYLWLVGNGGMEYNYNYYDYHSSIPYQPKAGKLRLWDISFYSIIGTLIRLTVYSLIKRVLESLRNKLYGPLHPKPLNMVAAAGEEGFCYGTL